MPDAGIAGICLSVAALGLLAGGVRLGARFGPKWVEQSLSSIEQKSRFSKKQIQAVQSPEAKMVLSELEKRNRAKLSSEIGSRAFLVATGHLNRNLIDFSFVWIKIPGITVTAGIVAFVVVWQAGGYSSTVEFGDDMREVFRTWRVDWIDSSRPQIDAWTASVREMIQSSTEPISKFIKNVVPERKASSSNDLPEVLAELINQEEASKDKQRE